MIGKTLDYISHHAIAILALVCSLLALAGASYAATQLPKNSVGSAQLKSGAVTPSKLSGKKFGGYIALYAKVNQFGKLVYSSPTAKVTQWAVAGSGSSAGTLGTVTWHQAVSSKRCSALTTSLDGFTPASIGAAFASSRKQGSVVNLVMGGPGPYGVTIAVVC